MDQYELQQNQIIDAINRYRKNRDKQFYRKIVHLLDMYQLYLDQNYAEKQKYDWHLAQKKLLNQIKLQKDLVGKSSSPRYNKQPNEGQAVQNIGKQFTKQLRKQVDQALKGGEKSLQKAIQLNKQIEELDAVFEENKKFESRMKRVKQGLNIILRQAITNKLTRCFAVLLVLAIIGVIVVAILRNQGIVK